VTHQQANFKAMTEAKEEDWGVIAGHMRELQTTDCVADCIDLPVARAKPCINSYASLCRLNARSFQI